MQQEGVSPRRLAAVGVLAVAYAFFGAYWGYTYSPARAVIDLVGGISFILAGLVAWQRRPRNRIGPLMVLLGSLAWFTVNLRFADDNPVVYTIGLLSLGPAFAFAAYVFLVFPDGRLPTDRFTRACAATFGAVTAVGMPVRMLFFDPRHHGCDGCSPDDNLVLVAGGARADELAGSVWAAAVIPAALWVVVVLGRRYVRATRPERRVFGPVFVAAGACMVWVVIAKWLVANVGQRYALVSDISFVLLIGTSTLVPIGMLVGILRTRAGRSPLSALLVRLHEVPTGGALRGLLAEALGDPLLRLGLWAPSVGGYVDEDGRPFPAPETLPPETTTLVDGREGPLAVLVHDAALASDRRMLAAVAAAARFALENERLQAEVRAQLAAVRESRARLVAAGDEQRRRIERDLHDGAQQRLVALAMGVQLLREQVGPREPALDALLAAVAEEARGAVAELRELAHGIHPAVLSAQGLDAALRVLAERSPLPVRLHGTLGDHRLPPTVEAAAYYACAEVLTNAAKHAAASVVDVTATLDGDVLRVDVVDDGLGGAVSGSGLRGVEDRVVALGGSLRLASGTGSGTRVQVTIPLAQDTASGPPVDVAAASS